MNFCVNHNHPDVVKLAGELNVHPAVAAARIGIWQKANNTNAFPLASQLINKSVLEPNFNPSLDKILKEYSIEELMQGVRLRSLQDKIKEKDFETIKLAYNQLKAEEKYLDIKLSNEKIKNNIEKLKRDLKQTQETKVGSVLTITNDENVSEYKVRVIDITKYSNYAILKVKTSKNAEYTIKVDKNGNTRTGYIEDFVFSTSNKESFEEIKEKINTFESQLQKLKSDPSDYYIDYFNNNDDSIFTDLNNLNLTPEVVTYLYNNSSKRTSLQQFGEDVVEFISILQGAGMSNQDILEKLKCL